MEGREKGRVRTYADGEASKNGLGDFFAPDIPLIPGSTVEDDNGSNGKAENQS